MLYSEDPAVFIKEALSPAKNVYVSIDENAKRNDRSIDKLWYFALEKSSYEIVMFSRTIQKIRTAERESIMSDFDGKSGEMMLGMLAMEDERNYYVDLGRARGILPKGEMIPGETVKMGNSNICASTGTLGSVTISFPSSSSTNSI